jgi:hypothetical protein
MSGSVLSFVVPVIRRRSIPPSAPQAIPGVHATRRRGARRDVTERVCFALEGREVAGWTLNLSIGGLRAVVEEPLELGVQLDVTVGAADRRPGRIVWVQEEQDGSIVGVAFLDADGAPPPSLPVPVVRVRR